MIQRIKEIMKFASENGFYLPGAYDARTKHSSISLLFTHITFIIAVVGIIAQLFMNLTLGVYCAIGYSGLMLAFYLMRSLGKVKLGKDGIELEDDDSDEEKTKEE